MDRNTIIAFILIGAILIAWLFLNTPKETQNQQNDRDSSLVQSDGTSDTTIKSKTKDESPIQDQKSKEENIYKSFLPATKDTGRIITVETDLAIYELSTQGGNIHKVYLKKFNNWYSSEVNDSSNFYLSSVQLINYSVGNAYDISFISSDGKAINTQEIEFITSSQSRQVIKDEDSVEIVFAATISDTKTIIKRYIFNAGSYLVKSGIEFINLKGVIADNTYHVIWGSGIRPVEKNSVNEAGFSSADIYYGDEKVVVNSPDNGEKISRDFNGRVDWLAVRNKYFAAIMIPSDPGAVEGAYIEGQTFPVKDYGKKKIYSVRLVVPFKDTDLEKRSFGIYIGPVDYDQLKNISNNLTALVDFGTFFGLKFVVRPIAEYLLLPLFNFLHLLIPNYGFVIIVFSLIIKILVYPLSRKSFQSMKKMQLLQPKIAELKEKLKDDPQKMNKETMKLYQTYGINPAGGCFPLLLQMPIFIALWGLFQAAIELRQQPFIFWINDLSVPDVIFDLGAKLPIFGIQEISGLALLMGITTFVQQKMSVKDPKQQMLVYMMPIMLTILFMTFPSGLNLYYFMFNVFSIAQQYYINHKQGNVVLEPVDPSKRKRGFMQKLMEAAEQQAKQQKSKR
jgi:YidC/Oxa1 family membrane protein insertase